METAKAGSARTRQMKWPLSPQAIRGCVNFPPPPCAPPEPLQPLHRFHARAAARHAVYPCQVDRHVEHGHAQIKPALLRQIPDPRGMRAAAADLVEQPHRTGIRLVNVHDHAQRRSLAGAVGAEQTVDVAGGDAQGKRIDGGVSCETLRDVIDDDGFGHGPKLKGNGKACYAGTPNNSPAFRTAVTNASMSSTSL